MATVNEILAAQAYAAVDETWTKDNNYPSFHLYVELEYVPVTNKRIADFNDQISVRGEENAQFVGFQLPRYDDGLDLTVQRLYIHYQTVHGGGDSVPCNVSWSDNYVRMCWQVPAQATQEPGSIQMMIYATGTDSVGEWTIWKTLPATYDIHDGLEIGGGILEPDPSWYEQFVQQMESRVTTAQGYANDAQASKTAASGSATAAAESAAASAKVLEDNKAYVESQKDTFVGYNKRETDLKYANALIGSASGTERVSIEDAWEAPIPGLEIAGRSEQMVTTGAQLFDASNLDDVSASSTVSDDKKEITVSGNKAYASTGIYIPVDLIAGKNVTLSCGIKNDNPGVTVSAQLTLTLDDNSKKYYQINNATGEKKIVVPNNITAIELRLYANNTATALDTPNTVIFTEVMLNIGDTALPWEPYTGGQPSPSADYPQPIISTGTVTTGAQLLPYPYDDKTVTRNGVTFTDNGDGTITINGTSTDTADFIFNRTKIPLRSGIIKSLYSSPEKAEEVWCQYDIYDGGGTYMGTVQGGKTIQSDDMMYLGLARIRVKSGLTVTNATIRPMLCLDSHHGTWEPYTEGKPSPSPEYPQLLDVTVTGAQLFDASLLESATVLGIKFTNNGDGSFTVDGTATGYANTYCPISLPPGTYSVSGGKNQPKFFGRISKDGLTYTDHLNSFTINGNEAWVRVFIQVSPNITVNETIWPMINAGSTALPWQSYQSKTAQISLTEPLRGIGDARDRITCRHGVWGVERQLVQLILDGNEDWLHYKSKGSNSFGTSTYDNLIKKDSRLMCNELKVDTNSNAWNGKNENVIAPATNADGHYLRVYINSTTTLDSLKASLTARPMIVIAERQSPTWTPLPADTQAALNALTTYTGTTHVTITAGGPEPDVGLEYVQDTRAVIADLQAQIDEIRNGGTT